jgi:hypothetical protein
VPATVTASASGQLGFEAGVSSQGNTLTFSGGPTLGAGATIEAALGGKIGGFAFEVGVFGDLTLVIIAVPATATIGSSPSCITYNIGCTMTANELSGNMGVFLDVALKPFFHKRFSHTLTQWTGPQRSLPLFRYDGAYHL